MTREQAKTTLSPGHFVTGAPVLSEHAEAVAKQVNWSAGNRGQTHLALTCAPEDVLESGSPRTLSLSFRASGAAWSVIQIPIQVQPEVVNLVCGAAVDNLTSPGPDDVVTVNFRIYEPKANPINETASVLLTFTGTAENDTDKTGTIATSSSGTGWRILVIDLETTVGSANADLLRVTVQDQVITSGQPAPIAEGDG